MRSVQPSAASTASALPIWAVAFPALQLDEEPHADARGARQLILSEPLSAAGTANELPDLCRVS